MKNYSRMQEEACHDVRGNSRKNGPEIQVKFTPEMGVKFGITGRLGRQWKERVTRRALY